jgi:hypothetical protein
MVTALRAEWRRAAPCGRVDDPAALPVQLRVEKVPPPPPNRHNIAISPIRRAARPAVQRAAAAGLRNCFLPADDPPPMIR